VDPFATGFEPTLEREFEPVGRRDDKLQLNVGMGFLEPFQCQRSVLTPPFPHSLPGIPAPMWILPGVAPGLLH
jgi:hypothetical protein